VNNAYTEALTSNARLHREIAELLEKQVELTRQLDALSRDNSKKSLDDLEAALVQRQVLDVLQEALRAHAPDSEAENIRALRLYDAAQSLASAYTSAMQTLTAALEAEAPAPASTVEVEARGIAVEIRSPQSFQPSEAEPGEELDDRVP
jgi:hypothetical protein